MVNPRLARVVLVFGMTFLASSVFAKEKAKSCAHIKPDSHGFIRGTVMKIVDGDTIHLSPGSSGTKALKIRMLSVDTPETHYLGKSQGYWGDQAAARLEEIIPVGTKIAVELGSDWCDQYGRILGYVFKGKRNVNRQLLDEGMAVNYCIYPNLERCEEFARATRKSREEKRGFFADKTVELPYIWRLRVSERENTKYIGDLFTQVVYEPGSYDRVAVPDRVFFMKETDVQAPYEMGE